MQSKIMTIHSAVRDHAFVIRPITDGDLEAILEVYRQCEDFLALGPVATASMEMVLKDIEISHEESGIFCGIFNEEGKVIGIIDYVPDNYRSNPQEAFLSLLMIAAPYRKQGLGQAVVEAVEDEIRKNARVRRILSGVQVNNPLAVRFWLRQGYRIISGPELMPDTTIVFGLRKDLPGESEPG
jgi:ribosomal protein S18 acetylase RimI-like enzyme